jgi:hypothetical protein
MLFRNRHNQLSVEPQSAADAKSSKAAKIVRRARETRLLAVTSGQLQILAISG